MEAKATPDFSTSGKLYQRARTFTFPSGNGTPKAFWTSNHRGKDDAGLATQTWLRARGCNHRPKSNKNSSPASSNDARERHNANMSSRSCGETGDWGLDWILLSQFNVCVIPAGFFSSLSHASYPEDLKRTEARCQRLASLNHLSALFFIHFFVVRLSNDLCKGSEWVSKPLHHYVILFQPNSEHLSLFQSNLSSDFWGYYNNVFLPDLYIFF